MIDFGRARKTMVDTQLRTNSVTERRLLAAMGSVPRERFVPEGWTNLAYIDAEVPLTTGAAGRAMAAPVPQARLIQLADVGKGDKVLVLGAATGYSAAVLASLAHAVVAVEPDPTLAQTARETLASLGVGNVTMRTGPIERASAQDGPFDAIIIETVVPDVPPALLKQLKDGGRLAALIGTGPTAVAHLFVKTGRDIAGGAVFNARMPALATGPREDEFVF